MKYFKGINLVVLVVFFYLFYTFNFKFFPTIQNILIYIMCIIYILANFKYLIKYLKFIYKSCLKYSILAIIICIIATLIIPTIYKTNDYSYLDTLLSIIRSSIKLVAILILFERIHKENASIQLFSKYIILINAIYVFTTIAFLLIPNFKQIWNSIIYDADYFILIKNPNYMSRYGIIGYSGFQVAFKMAFAVIINGFLIVEEKFKVEKSNILLYLLYLLLIIGSTFYGRIGMVVSLISFISLVILWIKKDKKVMLYLLILLFCILIVCVVAYNVSDKIKIWMQWALAPFINFIRTGKIYTGSSNIVFNRMIFIPKINTIFFGDGYYTDIDKVGYYMSTDVGFMRPMLFYGIFFTLIAYMSVIIPIVNTIGKSIKNHKNAILFLFVNFLILLIIIEIKGEIFYRLLPLLIVYIIILNLNEINKNEYKNDSISTRLKKSIKFFLIKVFNLFGINKNQIIFNNFDGKPFGDNGKYIVEEINNRKLKCKLIWTLKKIEDKATLPSNVRYVKYNSIKYFYNMCTSKIWIDNCRKTSDFRKRKEQYYIQTWHGGIALKKIEKDAQEVLTSEYIERAIHDSKMIDLMISNGEFCTEMYRRAFWYEGNILECGSPRNDILINNKKTDKERILNKLKIDKDKKIILYAPTFRKNGCLNNYDIDFQELLNNLNNCTQKEWIVLLRLHPNIADKSKSLYNNSFNNIIDMSNYSDMYELMLISDILISDYSSVIFEFSLNFKPVFLYAKDIEDYKQDRGFYFDYYKLPYDISTNTKQLYEKIKNFDIIAYKEKVKKFFNAIHIYEKGIASKKVVDVIEEKIGVIK